MVHYTVGGGVCDGLAYQSVCVCKFVCEHAYVNLLYDEWWMVWWVYFTYRTTSSVKRSGLIALSQWTAGPLGSHVVDSFTWSAVNILENHTWHRILIIHLQFKKLYWLVIIFLQVVIYKTSQSSAEGHYDTVYISCLAVTSCGHSDYYRSKGGSQVKNYKKWRRSHREEVGEGCVTSNLYMSSVKLKVRGLLL